MGENGAEVVDDDKETEGAESGTLIHLGGDEQLIALESIAKNAERMIAAKQQVWNVLLRIAKPGDWTVFESQGKKKAEIGHGGAMRYAAFLGISFTNWSAEKIVGTDEKGQWFRWDYECDCLFAGRSIRVYGRAGSRDRFFGKDHGAYKELHEISEGDIKIAARRSAMKEGVKTMLGLHHIPPDELEAAGVKMEFAGGHSFKSKDEKAAGGQSVTIALDSARLQKEGETNGKKWKWFMVKDAEGVDYNTFSETVYNAARAAIDAKKPVVLSWEPNTKGGRTITALSESK